jgi:hypothetical protein
MGGQILPAFSSQTLTSRRHLITDALSARIEDVVVDSGCTDSTTPTYRLRPGTVLVKRTSTGRYIAANDSNADVPTQAVVTASETADGDWASATITITLNGIALVTVSLGGSDDTDAEVVTALNGNAIFAANCIASASGSRVIVKTLRGGADVALKVTSSLSTAFGASGTFASGTDPEVAVTDDWVDLQDDAGNAINAPVKALCRGHFDLSELIVAGTAGSLRTMAPIAYAVLAKRGSIFQS